MAESSPDQLMEARREEMVSPTGGEPTLRLARFLTPSVTSMDGPVSNLPSSNCFSMPEFKKCNLKVNFRGWRKPQKDWKRWVDHMSSMHNSTWKKAGILDAIMNSTYTISQDEDLIFKFAEKWCPETNTFVFPWGEATITLEDMMILGGYAVLGEPIFRPVDTDGLALIEKKLLLARTELAKTKAKKVSQSLWLPKFMDSGSEIEHEAFLALWLSRFVFHNKCSDDTVQKKVIPIAVHLARGTRIALAPAILASIYANLSELKKVLVDSRRMQKGNEQDKTLELSISAPFQLVQLWIWERFPMLSPKPVTLEYGQPRFAKWNGSSIEDTADGILDIDETAGYFLWRPYAMGCKSSMPNMIYKENEQWALIGSDMDEDLEALVRCLRVSELVGIESDCIMQYLPHRVAMQFGIDQDLPGHIARVNLNRNIAWENYSRTVKDESLYIPPRLFEPDVTTRYMVWWKKSMSVQLGESESYVIGKGPQNKMSDSGAFDSHSLPRECNTVRASGLEKKAVADEVSPKSSGKIVLSSVEKKSDNESLFPPGFPTKPNLVETSSSDDKVQQMHAKWLWNGTDENNKALNIVTVTGAEYRKFIANRVSPKNLGNRVSQNSEEKKPNNDDVVNPCFPPKCNWVGSSVLEDEDGQTRVKRLKSETDGRGKSFRLTGAQYKKAIGNLVSSRSLEKSTLLHSAGRKSDNDDPVTPGFPPKPNTVGTNVSDGKDAYFQGKSMRNNAEGRDNESVTVQNMQVEPLETNVENEKEKENSITPQGYETESGPGAC